LPFAVISEFVVDHPKFWKTIFKLKNEDEVDKSEVRR